MGESRAIDSGSGTNGVDFLQSLIGRLVIGATERQALYVRYQSSVTPIGACGKCTRRLISPVHVGVPVGEAKSIVNRALDRERWE